MAKDKSPETRLAEFVHNLDDDYLRCRARGRHREPDPLDPAQTHYARQPNGTFLQEATCLDCGRDLVKIVAASGHLDEIEGYARPDYPDGYLLPEGVLGKDSTVTRKAVNAAMRREARLRNMRSARRGGQATGNSGNGGES